MKKFISGLFLLLIIFVSAENKAYSEISIQSQSENYELIDDYIDMAKIYASSAEYEKALEYIDIIGKLYPNNPKILYEKAVILKNYNQPILARNLMQDIVQLDPNYKETYLYKEFFKDEIPGYYMPKDYSADYYTKKGEEAYNECKYEKALEYFRKAAIQEKSVKTYNNIGKAFVKTNNPKKALKSFEEAINLDVKAPETYINLALYYCDIEHNSKKQMHYLKTVIKLDSKLAKPYYLMGNIYLDKGMYETAIEYYRLALAKDDTNFDTYYALGSTLFKLQEYEEAFHVFEKSLTVELDNPKVYEYLAKSAIELRRYDEAQSYIQKAVSIEPSPNNYLLLAKILYQKWDYDRSIELLNSKIGNSKNADMYNYLGLNYFQKNKYNEALKCFSNAVKINKRPSYLYNIAVVYNTLNEKEQMEIFLDKALNAGLHNADDYIDVANIYLDMNKTDDALSILTKGIEIYPYERKLYNAKLNILQKTGRTKEYNLMKIQINSKFPKETVYMGK